jgi:hypothetical protein
MASNDRLVGSFKEKRMSNLWHPAYDPRGERNRSDRVSTNQITIPMIIDAEEYHDREAELISLKADGQMRQKIFDVRDKEPILVKRGRGQYLMRTANTVSISGGETMKHIMPGFTSVTGLINSGKSWVQIYEEYRCIGLSNGDDSLTAPHGFAGMIEGMKSYDYYGQQELFEGTPLVWIHQLDPLFKDMVDEQAIKKRETTKDVVYLVPASQTTLHYDAVEYRRHLNSKTLHENRNYNSLISNTSDEVMSVGERAALSEYYYLMHGAVCANQALMTAGLGGFVPDANSEMMDALLKLKDLLDAPVPAQDDVNDALQNYRVAMKKFKDERAAAAEAPKTNPNQKPTLKMDFQKIGTSTAAFAKAVQFVTDSKEKGADVGLGSTFAKFFVSAFFDGMSTDSVRSASSLMLSYKKDPDTELFNKMVARGREIVQLTFRNRYRHLASLLSRIVGHAGSHGKAGDSVDVVVRNYSIESILPY